MLSPAQDLTTFEAHRRTLMALAYRMLGDVARAEDIVQEAWLRWQGRDVEVDAPRAYLLQVATRLCLNELDTARARREESRGDRLPEPVDVDDGIFDRVEMTDEISMAFLVVLQRLTPAERAVLLLHDVFEQSHAEIGALLDRSEAACRKLLSRARENVANHRDAPEASHEEHRRLLEAFVRAVNGGEYEPMIALLARDSTLIVDPGPNGGRVGRIRNVGRPVQGAERIAAFLVAVAKQRSRHGVEQVRMLNGQPAIVVMQDGRVVAVVSASVAGGKIRQVFIHADGSRLARLH